PLLSSLPHHSPPWLMLCTNGIPFPHSYDMEKLVAPPYSPVKVLAKPKRQAVPMYATFSRILSRCTRRLVHLDKIRHPPSASPPCPHPTGPPPAPLPPAPRR